MANLHNFESKVDFGLAIEHAELTCLDIIENTELT